MAYRVVDEEKWLLASIEIATCRGDLREVGRTRGSYWRPSSLLALGLKCLLNEVPCMHGLAPNADCRLHGCLHIHSCARI
jgi:hypothetical protein